MSDEIAVTCTAASGVDPAAAARICDEFTAYLRNAHPDRGFSGAADQTPRMDVTVTKALDRAVAMVVTYVPQDGPAATGQPQQMTFFDGTVDTARRQDFYRSFLVANPLPF